MKPVRWQLLRSLIVASAPLLGCTPSVTPTSTIGPAAGTPAQRVIAIADDYLVRWRETFPEVNTVNGIPGSRHDRLTDNSAAAEKAWQAKEDRWLAQMRTIDPSTLIGRPEWVTYGLLREELAASTAMRTSPAERRHSRGTGCHAMLAPWRMPTTTFAGSTTS